MITNFSSNDHLLIPHGFWTSSKRQMIIRLNVSDQLSQRNNVLPEGLTSDTWITNLILSLLKCKDQQKYKIKNQKLCKILLYESIKHLQTNKFLHFIMALSMTTRWGYTGIMFLSTPVTRPTILTCTCVLIDPILTQTTILAWIVDTLIQVFLKF